MVGRVILYINRSGFSFLLTSPYVGRLSLFLSVCTMKKEIFKQKKVRIHSCTSWSSFFSFSVIRNGSKKIRIISRIDKTHQASRELSNQTILNLYLFGLSRHRCQLKFHVVSVHYAVPSCKASCRESEALKNGKVQNQQPTCVLSLIGDFLGRNLILQSLSLKAHVFFWRITVHLQLSSRDVRSFWIRFLRS